MLSCLRSLAVAVDGLDDRRAATIIETSTALTIAGLAAVDVQSLLPLLRSLGWQFQIVDDAGESADAETITESYQPFVLTLSKPQQEISLLVISAAGFKTFLKNERADENWEVVSLSMPFSTMRTSFVPWGTAAIFSPAPPTKSPRELVREYSTPLQAPVDIRAWMLRNAADDPLWNDRVFRIFADLSAQSLMYALAGEIKANGTLVFNGPPYTQLSGSDRGAATVLNLDGFNKLRATAAWVYESNTEASQRHGLFVAEFARTHPIQADAAGAFASVIGNVLQGARFAYQLSLSELTREAIKAQGDLRKAVADDTAKLADNTRQVVTALTAALATGIGLIAAKIAATTPAWVLEAVSWIAACYVAAIIVSGWLFMSVQRDMRKKWRHRLYRFIPDADYKAMVTDPASRAETVFIVTALAGGLCAILEVVLVAYV